MGALAGGILQGVAQGKTANQEREQTKKMRDAQVKLYELQLEQEQRRQAALQKLQPQPPPPLNPDSGMVAAPMQNAGQPAPVMPKGGSLLEMLASVDLPTLIDAGIDPVQLAKAQQKPEQAVQRPTNDMMNFQLAQTDPRFAQFLQQRQTQQQGPQAGLNFAYTQDENGNMVAVQPTMSGPKFYPLPPGMKTPTLMRLDPNVVGDVEAAKVTGQERGTAEASLSDAESTLPRLEQVALELSDLGKQATYTKAGQFADTVKRELGMEVGPGAVARAAYIAKVDNEVLPLLRQTFGAAFTQKEGESLKAIFGDPNRSPEEKDAALQALISSKQAQVQTKATRAGKSTTGNVITSQEQYDALPSGATYTGPDGKTRRKP